MPAPLLVSDPASIWMSTTDTPDELLVVAWRPALDGGLLLLLEFAVVAVEGPSARLSRDEDDVDPPATDFRPMLIGIVDRKDVFRTNDD